MIGGRSGAAAILLVSLVGACGGAGTPSAPPSSAPPAPGAWARLGVTRLDGAPPDVGQVISWRHGLVALTLDGDGAFTAWRATEPAGTWQRLDGVPLGPVSGVGIAGCGETAVAAATTAEGRSTIWRTVDGVSWRSHPTPGLRLERDGDLSCNRNGIAAIQAAWPYRLAFSRDGSGWETVSLPGGGDVQAVVSFLDRFVAVGDAGVPGGRPMAWSSADGVHWGRAAVAPDVGGGFVLVRAGSSGLIALSTTGGVPGRVSLWASRDGVTWRVVDSPLGLVDAGAGVGSVNGVFVGDGTRLLAFGTRPPAEATEVWLSEDGVAWTQVGATGPNADVLSSGQTPFLLPDGLLFSDGAGSWFAAPSP